jgi:hypothetical protein
MTGHTRDPWRLCGRRIFGPGDPGHDDKTLIAVLPEEWRRGTENEANARLIIEAPTLLEKSANALTFFEVLASLVDKGRGHEALLRLRDLNEQGPVVDLRASIERAEGRSVTP